MKKFRVGDKIVITSKAEGKTAGYYHPGMKGIVVSKDDLVSFDGGKTTEWEHGICVYVNPKYADLIEKEKKQLYKATEETLKLYKSSTTKVILRNGEESLLFSEEDTECPYYHNFGEEGRYHAVYPDGKSCINVDSADVVAISLKPSRVIKKLGKEAEQQLRYGSRDITLDIPVEAPVQVVYEEEPLISIELSSMRWGYVFDALELAGYQETNKEMKRQLALKS